MMTPLSSSESVWASFCWPIWSLVVSNERSIFRSFALLLSQSTSKLENYFIERLFHQFADYIIIHNILKSDFNVRQYFHFLGFKLKQRLGMKHVSAFLLLLRTNQKCDFLFALHLRYFLSYFIHLNTICIFIVDAFKMVLVIINCLY